jgi:hypothetical protein
MRLKIRELALRRYAERFDHPRVTLAGTTTTLELARELFSPDVPPGAPPAAVVEGRREFGGISTFELPQAIRVPTATDEAERHALSRASGQLVEMLAALCLCGRFPGDCDCCGACQGLGFVHPDGAEASTCWRCAGMGYVPRELRDEE